jgi:O-antigen ligase
VATSLRNGLVLSLLLLSPWAFACVYPQAQIFIKSLATALGATLLYIRYQRPQITVSRRDGVLALLTITLFVYGLAAIPSSFDPTLSAYTLWGYAGLAALFWSIRDWAAEDPTISRKLLWFILVNAGVIGVTAIANRLSASHHVLWVYRPEVVSTYYVFGPFEYRATASQFFNLLWPAALGLYLQDHSLKSPPPRGAFPASLLVVLVTCPLITSSRGGMLMTIFGATIMVVPLLLGGHGPHLSKSRDFVIVLSVVALFLLFGSKPLQKRWRESRSVAQFLNLNSRLAQNDYSWRIIADHPLWGVGAGNYEPVFRSYGFKNVFKPNRPDDPREQATWDFFYAKAHNDWLQTLAEWGIPATCLILAALLCAALAPFVTAPYGPLQIGIGVGILITILHGAFDYPLQNLAILIHLVALLALNYVTPELQLNSPSRAENKEPSLPDLETTSPVSASASDPLPPAVSPPASAPSPDADSPPP